MENHRFRLKTAYITFLRAATGCILLDKTKDGDIRTQLKIKV
jgi:hypothetical protein